MSFTESLDELVASDRSGLLAIAPGWARVRLGDVCSILNGFPFSSHHFGSEGGTPLIRIRDVLRGSTETHYLGEFDTNYLVRHGDLLVGMDGDFNCAAWAGPDALLNQRVCKLVPDEARYSRRFLLLALPGYLAAINRKTSSVTVKHLSSRTVQDIPLPLPPRPLQDQLVAAIESHFSRLDTATATLERVQRNLERYRASVLKAAVEGRLVPTEAELAKKEGRSYEPASVLLKRILAERRRRWEEAELAKLKAKGKPPADDRWKAKYQEPAAPDTTDLPELPEGWCWASMDQLGIISGGLTKNAHREKLAKQRPYLRVANVYADELRLDEIKRIGVTEDEAERAELLADDLLVVEGNGSVDQIGRVALWNGSVPGCVHQNHIIKVRFAGATLPKWSLSWMLSTSGRGHIERAASSTSGLHTLSLSKIASLPVPVPPEAEQLRVRSELDRMLSGMANLHGSAAHGKRRVQRLRQSILKWAFEGRLVDQPPGAALATALVVNPATMRRSAPTKPSVRR